ncbi:MAG: hypothetical protein AUG51_20755 [Acidobacteria bacterium 13_1_20CM_3_53_8]|nr:MAG: hypothetical protein AUG51_20755 [Acidobacteria bacterium 13_1_20CM_3_53_8]
MIGSLESEEKKLFAFDSRLNSCYAKVEAPATLGASHLGYRGFMAPRAGGDTDPAVRLIGLSKGARSRNFLAKSILGSLL